MNGSGLRLVPVLELSAYLVREPAARAPRTDEERHRDWLDAWAALGVTGLEPIERGWPEVAFERVDEPVLMRVLEPLTAGRENPYDAPLSGGFVPMLNGRPLVRPGCCYGLGDLEHWELWAGAKGEWRAVWTGHDGRGRVHLRWRADDHIELAVEPQRYEHGGPDVVRVTLTRAAYETLLEEARGAQRRFAVRLTAVLADRGVPGPERAAQVLAGLAEDD